TGENPSLRTNAHTITTSLTRQRPSPGQWLRPILGPWYVPSPSTHGRRGDTRLRGFPDRFAVSRPQGLAWALHDRATGSSSPRDRKDRPWLARESRSRRAGSGRDPTRPDHRRLAER